MATTTKKTTPDAPHIPEAWERIPEESVRAFAAFARYRDLPPELRSIRRAHETAPKPRGGSTAHLRQWELWSAEHYWPTRARQWDEYRDREHRVSEVAAIRAMGVRHAEAASLLVEKGVEALKKINPEELPFGDLVRYIVEGAKLERLARGEIDPDVILVGGEQSPQDSIRELLSEDPDLAKSVAMVAANVARVRRQRQREANPRED